MSQRELAEIIGIIHDHQVSSHERSFGVPSFLVALSYEAVFRVPVSGLFPGFAEAVLANVEERLAEMERKLLEKTTKGRRAEVVARQLEWLRARRVSANADASK
jgi:DNA-binding XRE family transcriptional regulator